MFPRFPHFKPLELEDINFISRKLKAINPTICELSLANLYIWKDFDHAEMTCINDNLCLRLTPAIEPAFFLEPLDHNKPVETARTCIEYSGRISRASEQFISLLNKEPFKFQELRDQDDYVYSTKTLAELKGKKYDGKRNHIKRFKRHFPEYQFIPLALEHKKACLELFEKWFAIRKDSKFFPRLAYISQKNAVEESFAYFERLHLFGGALMANGKLEGFTIASKLNDETVDVHFLYTNPDLPGSSQTILWEACQKTYAKYQYANLEQDLGIPGLRKSKLSYHPLKLEKKFTVELI